MDGDVGMVRLPIHRWKEAPVRRLWRLVLLVQACSGFIVMPWLPGSAAEPPSGTPELRLSLHDAIQAAIDNNANVRLLKERIVAAQSAASTSLGALLPNVSGLSLIHI